MNPEGSIAQFETTKDAHQAGYRTALTPREAAALLTIKNRNKRHEQLRRIRQMEARKKKGA